MIKIEKNLNREDLNSSQRLMLDENLVIIQVWSLNFKILEPLVFFFGDLLEAVPNLLVFFFFICGRIFC